MKLAAALLLFVMVSLIGCAAPPAEESEGAAESNQAASSASMADVSAAFAVDYGVSDSLTGTLLVGSGSFRTIEDDELTETLPDGDARAAAKCLADRQDSLHGDTLTGLTWKHEHRKYFVLVVALDDMQGLHDLHMLFVFEADGSPAFQALTWDGKQNVKITFGRSACPH
ncbi:MAG: hypothetical protein U0270_15355 [Labilithrix sp.]|mgnify:FL=1